MTAFTPGPWRVKHRHIHAEHDSDEMGGLGWELTGPPKPMRGDFARAADARLIASAPDLLGTLQLLADIVDDCYADRATRDDLDRAMHQARLSIKKARGES